jgi:hypothetical protein
VQLTTQHNTFSIFQQLAAQLSDWCVSHFQHIKDLDEAELALLAVEQRILDRTGRDQPLANKGRTSAYRANQQRPGVCWMCGKPGHYRRDCPIAKQQQHGAMRLVAL